MKSPSLLIQFDPTTWAPTKILFNGETDQLTAKLQEIADRMIEAIREDKDET